MIMAGSSFRLRAQRQIGKCFAVPRRNLAPAPIPVVERPQFDAQDRGMEFVETAVLTEAFGRIALMLAIVAQKPRPPNDFRVRRHDDSSITVRTQILRRIETECGRCTEGPAAPHFASLPVRLRGVFYKRNSAFRDFLQSSGHTVKMNRHDCLRT